MLPSEEYITFNRVKNQTTEEYFEGNVFSINAFNSKYKIYDNETYVGAIKRVCKEVASVEETPKLRQYWSNRWFSEIYNDWWHPAGSIMQGAGSGKKISLGNCVAINMGKLDDKVEWDNLESIIRNMFYKAAKCAAYRQGLGVDFSRLRPKNSSLSNSAQISSGSINWMKFLDSLGNFVGQCLHGDTNVLTKNGYITIKEIVDKQLSCSIVGKNKWVKVCNWFKNGKKKIYQVTTQYGDVLKLSEDHKILTTNGKVVYTKSLKDIKVDDFIVSKRINITTNKYVKTNVYKFRYPISTYNNSNRLTKSKKLPKIIDEHFGYLMGYMYGDGCETQNHIELTIGYKRPEIKLKINQCLYHLFDMNIGDYGLSCKPGDGNCEIVYINQLLTKFFHHCGFKKNKAGHLIFPNIIKKSPNSVLLAFFAGLFDADGHNSQAKKNIDLMLKDYNFLYDLKLELAKCSIISNLRVKNKEKGYWRLSIVGKKSVSILENKVPSVKIQERNLSGKYDRLKTPYLGRIIKGYNDYLDINGDEYLSDTKYIKYFNKECPLYIQKIKSIEYIDKYETYDLTVDDDKHLFLANNILVSNSGRVPALLVSLSCDHPDLLEFIDCKKDFTQIQNANLSVQCTNDFYTAIENDDDWELKFTIPKVKKGQKVYIDKESAGINCKIDTKSLPTKPRYYYLATHDKKEEVISKVIKARKILELIAKAMLRQAEPGIQNIDIARYWSNSDYVYDKNSTYNSKIVGTNACCLVGTTKVLTNNGSISIKELHRLHNEYPRHSLLIASYNHKEDIYEYKKLVNIWQQRNDTTISITLENSYKQFNVECSEDHPILITNRGYIKAIELTEQDNIQIFSNRYNTEEEKSIVTQAKLIKIEQLNIVKELYDIEVEDNHNFVVNGGIVVKNSEQYLSADSLCILSSINMGKFSPKEEKYEQQLNEIGPSINRFLDNVNELELKNQTYAVPQQEIAIRQLRRTGAGITNIAEWLLKGGFKYGDTEGNTKVSLFVERYNYYLYKSSISLGKEKGNFGLFNRKKLEQSPFIQHMMDQGLKFTHLRNITCSSIAPNGTLSLMFKRAIMSYGVEPPFGLYFWKRTRMSGNYEYYFCVPRIVRELFEKAGYPIDIQSDTIKDSWDGKYGNKVALFIDQHKDSVNIKYIPPEKIDYKKKLDLMSQLMKNIDSSISVTYTLPSNSTWKNVYNFILEAEKKNVKSITGYPDKKMYGIVSTIPFRLLAQNLIEEKVDIHRQNFTDDEWQWLNISTSKITPTTAPKRPRVLPCNVHHTTVNGRDYFILVGLLNNNEPYEVFAGKNGFLPKKVQSGKIIRKRQGYYIAEFDDSDVQLSPITASTDEMEDIITRLTSMSLRHGADMHFIVKQLEQVGDKAGGINNFAKSVARTLKKYIKDGTIESGIQCPTCHSKDIVRIDGCLTCSKCQWSKCS